MILPEHFISSKELTQIVSACLYVLMVFLTIRLSLDLYKLLRHACVKKVYTTAMKWSSCVFVYGTYKALNNEKVPYTNEYLYSIVNRTIKLRHIFYISIRSIIKNKSAYEYVVSYLKQHGVTLDTVENESKYIHDVVVPKCRETVSTLKSVKEIKTNETKTV